MVISCHYLLSVNKFPSTGKCGHETYCISGKEIVILVKKRRNYLVKLNGMESILSSLCENFAHFVFNKKLFRQPRKSILDKDKSTNCE